MTKGDFKIGENIICIKTFFGDERKYYNTSHCVLSQYIINNIYDNDEIEITNIYEKNIGIMNYNYTITFDEFDKYFEYRNHRIRRIAKEFI